MHFYALGYSEFLKLPYYTFWELARNTDRIKSSDDLRLLALLGNAFAGDSGAYVQGLKDTIGVVVEEEDFVKAGEVNSGLLNLRAMMGGM